jgi:tyrosyl-tRNA synthetase
MSISDDTMWDYYKLLLLRDKDAILDLKKNHPMEMKKELARELTALFYDLETAENEKQSFSQVFTQRENPEEMDSYSIAKILAPEDSPNVLNILAKSMIFESKGQIRRLIKQGAIKINGQKVESSEDIINLGNTESGVVVKAGKKIFFKVVG